MTLFYFEYGELENDFMVTCKYNNIPKYIIVRFNFARIIVCSERLFSKN